MVVKASTKPWPRQLGSSTFRALPPLVKPCQVRPARVESSHGRGRGGARAGDTRRAGRGARIVRVRPSHVEHEWCLSARVAAQLPKRGSQWAVPPGCTTLTRRASRRAEASQVRSGQVKTGQAGPAAATPRGPFDRSMPFRISTSVTVIASAPVRLSDCYGGWVRGDPWCLKTPVVWNTRACHAAYRAVTLQTHTYTMRAGGACTYIMPA